MPLFKAGFKPWRPILGFQSFICWRGLTSLTSGGTTAIFPPKRFTPPCKEPVTIQSNPFYNVQSLILGFVHSFYVIIQ